MTEQVIPQQKAVAVVDMQRDNVGGFCLGRVTKNGHQQ